MRTLLLALLALTLMSFSDSNSNEIRPLSEDESVETFSVETTSSESGNSTTFSNLKTLIGGTIYREFEHNGQADIGDDFRFMELGMEGVIINIYDDDQALLGSTMSTSDGSWMFDVTGSSGTMVLIEFVIPIGYDSGPSGANNKNGNSKGDDRIYG